jgi:hypothetical protein
MIPANLNHVPYLVVVFSGFILGHHAAFQLPFVVRSNTHYRQRDNQNHLITAAMEHRNSATVSRTALGMSESSSEIEENLPFDEEIWAAYESAVSDVLESRRVLMKEKLEDLENATKAILSRKRLSSIPSPLRDGEATMDYLKQQKERYMEHYNLSPAQYNYAVRSLVYLGDFCAKRQRATGIRVAWEKMKESGVMPRENAISTYMYVLGTDDTCSDTLIEVAAFHDLLFPANEKTTTLRIKALIARNDVEEAETILSSLSVSVSVLVYLQDCSLFMHSLICASLLCQPKGRARWSRMEKVTDVHTYFGTLLHEWRCIVNITHFSRDETVAWCVL